VREGVEHGLEWGTHRDRGDGRFGRRVASRQDEEVAVLGGVEPENAGEAVQKLFRGSDRTALLEPGIPGNAEAGQMRHLLPPESRSPTPTTGDEAGIDRTQPLSPRAEKLGQL